jgi:two-component system, response regulator YesN
MYTILLVDDEKLELETLEHYIPWRDMGIHVAGTAANGKEALEKLSSIKPDIVLTDVRMPIMDGLEFARRAKRMDKQVKIVFLSGHNEFQYIKAALSVEAIGYLLKPLDLEELTELMNRVKRKCEDDRLSSQSEEWVREKLALQLIRETNEELRKEWTGKLAILPSGFPAYGDFASAVITIDPLNRDQLLGSAVPRVDFIERIRTALRDHFRNYILVESDSHSFTVLIHLDPKQIKQASDRALWISIHKQLNDQTEGEVTIGLSAPVHGLEQLQRSYRSAKQANDFKFYLNAGKVIMQEDLYETVQGDIEIESYATELIQCIKQEKELQTEAFLSSFIATLKDKKIRKNQAIHAIIRMVVVVEQQFSALLAGSDKDLLLADHWKEISSMATLEQIKIYFARYCASLIATLKERDKDRNLQLIDQIVKLIDERHHLPITVDDIAKEVFLSPNYIRTLFKDRMGETILDYMTKQRIQHASELLRDKSLKIHEISHAVGYENVSYFCSVFHKHKGSTPNEYRKKYL